MASRPSPTLAELDAHAAFVDRHVGVPDDAIAPLLAEVGVASLDELLDAAVPESIRHRDALNLPTAISETAAQSELRALAEQNESVTSLIGLGYHDTITPPVIRRNILENPAWYTAYTPYQPEISQGRLEAVLNFQTMVADLTGMDIANASLLDEGTAAAEAMTLLHRLSRNDRNRFVVDPDCHPQTIAVVATRAEPLGLVVDVADPTTADLSDAFGVLTQYPGSSGQVKDLAPLASRAHDAGALVAVAADILALLLLKSPGEAGADVVVGTTQRFGVPLGFGGPHAAYMAVREGHQRSLPGRLVGVSVDAHGRPALRLALQTREQHIRREKATSNICTAQVLLAVIASTYAVHHGPDGLRQIAQRVNRLTTIAAAGLDSAGFDLIHKTFFDTVTVAVPGRAAAILADARAAGLNLRLVDEDHLSFSLDETSSADTVETLWGAFGVAADLNHLDVTADPSLPDAILRTDDPLPHPVFRAYRSETDLMRYLRRLADRDLALDRTMIPLGSCTMKLNAAAEMEPISWPSLAGIHPFAPSDQTVGYRTIIKQLEDWLVEITGYAAVSLQPNSGAQGELAGLLAIRAYHQSRGDHGRTTCLIPASAHGTNAASAVMAGMKVVVVACDKFGNVDVDDLKSKVVEHGDDLAVLMVTYPSTHGVFETAITDICATVHDYGGQVYLDGANLNAMVGVARPGRFGADVSHLNLHKTFCIPHGGGGPGVGPVAVGAHLAPFLPNHPLVAEAGPETGCGPVAAAPWGSAGILAISWMYIRMMGPVGLKRATAVAILNANYIARRLSDAYPVLYTGPNNFVAHECILDTRIFDAASVDDIAKRLIDYGFHAPTMSFPVAGTLMVEPTESESVGELDRFCDAMLSIRAEIDQVAAGVWPRNDNPLANAPHTAIDVMATEWAHPYPREVAGHPTGPTESKYWPPVSRIDGAHGDRNLICSCPPLDVLAEPASA